MSLISSKTPTLGTYYTPLIDKRFNPFRPANFVPEPRRAMGSGALIGLGEIQSAIIRCQGDRSRPSRVTLRAENKLQIFSAYSPMLSFIVRGLHTPDPGQPYRECPSFTHKDIGVKPGAEMRVGLCRRVNEMRPEGPGEATIENGSGSSERGPFSTGDSTGRPNEIARSDQRELRSGPPA